MGVRFPTDLDEWRRWQARRSPLRTLKHRVRPAPPARYKVGVRGDARVLVAFESSSTSTMLALGTPLRHLTTDLAVLAPDGFDETLLTDDLVWRPAEPTLTELLPRGGVVLSTGHYLPLGNALYRQSRVLPVTFATVQHGLMTPIAPPVAPDATLLSWSDADAAFWSDGQRGVEAVIVGSQLLWQAQPAQPSPTATPIDDPPVFLGQLHGAELPRADLTRTSFGFCRATGATYRPHPAERDKASRLTHAAWKRLGIDIDTRPTPIRDLGRPVVSIFSTGVLEAAAAGLPAFVHHPNPPAWLPP